MSWVSDNWVCLQAKTFARIAAIVTNDAAVESMNSDITELVAEESASLAVEMWSKLVARPEMATRRRECNIEEEDRLDII